MSLDLKIKRVYDPPEAGDGMRILVDRIWPRGVSKEAAALTLWLKEIAPSTELRKWFDHDPARWSEFQSRYRSELDANPDAVAQLRDLLKKGRATLLYAAHDAEHNNALVLADYIHQTNRRPR
ncbi:MAG: DUF488 domain-containing protein [Methylocella sp.]